MRNSRGTAVAPSRWLRNLRWLGCGLRAEPRAEQAVARYSRVRCTPSSTCRILSVSADLRACSYTLV